MTQKVIVLILLLISIHTVLNSGETPEYIDLGKFTDQRIAEIINESSTYSSNNKKIDFISEQFINTPYQESTLIGDDKTEEVLTINLSGLDCFTYIDYVEAIRLSSNYNELRDNLITVRYKNRDIAYPERKHFFSDWVNSDSKTIKDITRSVGGDSAVSVTKALNKKQDGSLYLAQLPVVKRNITYIPTDKIDKSVADKLQTGDYVGIYTDKNGLDVSHTGIIIKKGGKLYLRHASSRSENRRVVDEELLNYLMNKPGIVVYRPI